jgi:glycosyltransferase involved in cell wall biosynthesis
VKQLAYNMVMKDAAKSSAKIIAISKTTEKDVIDFYGTKKDKFELVYHGIDHERYNTRIQNSEFRIKQFKDKYKIDGDYILYTGMWKKHKNLLRLFQAYEQFLISKSEILNKSQIQNSKFKLPQLVLTGKIDQKEPEVIAEINRINNEAMKQYNNLAIITTGFIDEEELPIAYAGAMAYVIPSLSEGFGWPPLEAMACGTPVISSNVSCMPEILGDAPLYFDPYDVDDMQKAITKIATDPGLRKKLSAKGLEQVKKYNWAETAKKTLDVYKEVLN